MSVKLEDIPKEDILGYEARHVTYCVAEDGNSDLHVVKEYVHLKNGERIPNIRTFKNFKRPLWVTREGFRNHKDKKEYEEESKLIKYEVPQFKLLDKIASVLTGYPKARGSFKQLAESPYLYGCDISSCAILRQDLYKAKFPNCISPKASVAVLDIETDVVYGTSEIILITISFGSKVITAINKSFIPESSSPIENSLRVINEVMGETVKKRNLNIELVVCDTAADCVKTVMQKAHEWKPDFITIWNIDFDLPVINSTLVKAGVNLAEVFSDPSIPTEYKFYNYRQGKKKKITQAGDEFSLHWADRWHTVECPASFYFLDAACIYKRIRIAKGMEPSYSLDAILNKHLGLGKLSVPEVEHLDGLEWHMEMQKRFPFHYVAYNIFDCVSVEMLDEKNGDINSSFPILCGVSDYANFNSNPRRIVDDMHFFYREFGLVIATTGADLKKDEDDHVINLTDWIATLPAHLMGNSEGLCLIKELPNIRSRLIAHSADIDIEGTYPTNEGVCNIAKETTVRELSAIEGLPESKRREVGINISGGPVNAIEICVEVLDMPTPIEWLGIFDNAV